VRTVAGQPIAGAQVAARAPSGRYGATADNAGRFIILAVEPDTYAVSVTANGYEPASQVAVIAPVQRDEISFVLRTHLHEIARVEAKTNEFAMGSTSDTFTATGDAARASFPTESSSGLASYTQGSVQGALATAPGVQFDAFANAIVRGGKVQNTVFDYDSVPIPQGLIAEPGGNIVGAQLSTTDVDATTLTLNGFSDVCQNALGGVVASLEPSLN
jgi:hypothetical protein